MLLQALAQFHFEAQTPLTLRRQRKTALVHGHSGSSLRASAAYTHYDDDDDDDDDDNHAALVASELSRFHSQE